MEKNAVILDFDGTLADSMPFLEKIGVQIMISILTCQERMRLRDILQPQDSHTSNRSK